MPHLVLFFALLFQPSGKSCPWLEDATAKGILGGPVTSENGPTTCTFIREEGRTRVEAHIEVRNLAPQGDEFARLRARCGKKATPLTGVGTEAYACNAQEIIGRVRDRAFIIRMKAGGKRIPKTTVEQDLRTIAEHVAGSLF